ncbi:MAG TPA: glycosyltransferase family 2 protein [Flavobacterium sp.]|uniref:glycosyltransferase family 2 protein n=1 Tax=Flavobacterium sp. TaxID=239 RepID=UPI002C7D3F7D|nr:glycosyltransferase family 2 protein [Flavobacterium sp.]HSD14883.1 glycosyltransferase family 2 protein [Flavobacterium sp.]
MFLSVCIITKNEESSIEKCLKSVSEIADEIVILDSFSTDRTTVLAQKYTDKIYYSDWIDDFSYARNLCISKAKGKWILIIDADEVFHYDRTFLDFLKKAKEEAYLVFRNEIYRNKSDNKLVSYPVGILRLFVNSGHVKFQYPIHERLDNYFIENNIKIGVLQNAFLNHNIFETDDDKIILKQKYYLEIIHRQLEDIPNDQWLLFQKAKTNFFLKKKQESESDLKRLISDKSTDKKIRIAAFVFLSNLYKDQNEILKSVDLLKQGLDYKKCTLLYLFLGDAFYSDKLYWRALGCYLRMKTSPSRMSYNDSMYLISYVEPKDKIFKIASSIYSLGYLWLSKFYLLSFKSKLGADSFFLMGLIYLKKNQTIKGLRSLEESIRMDSQWKKPVDLYGSLQKNKGQ